MRTTTADARAVWAFAEHEHRDLARGLNRIHDVACETGRRATPQLSADILGVLRWLDSTLEPHIAWEEGWLYPHIERLTGTPWATRPARYDHDQIHDMAARLRADQHRLGNGVLVDDYAEIRCHLFSLEALLRSHIEREERFLIPILNDGGSSDAG
jgi:iron-sulfur cluster repair protein YtfE (RIC family)